MDELISKRAVIEAIEKARANVGHNLERSIGKSIIEILDDVGRDVDRLPSAQPKKGKWIYGENFGNGQDGYFCSECGWFEAVDYDFPIDSEENNPTNFCPNCGAKMEVTT